MMQMGGSSFSIITKNINNMNEEKKWNQLMTYAMDLDAEIASRLRQVKDQVIVQEEGDTDDDDTINRLSAHLKVLKQLDS